MRKLFFLALACVSFVAVPPAAGAQAVDAREAPAVEAGAEPTTSAVPDRGTAVPTAPDLSEAIRAARALLDSLRRAEGIPGLSAAVGLGGRVVWSEGFGFADLENRTPVTPLTRFRIGSVSKSMTSIAVGQLHAAGRLDLDAPVQRYVPAFPRKRWPFTTRQVAGHTAGVRHYDGDEFLSAHRYETVAEGLEIFADDSLLFEPGTEFRYSSYGWNLVSAVVEGASGEPFLDYMDAHVFGPAGLRRTAADLTDRIIPFRTRFYERNGEDELVNAPYVDNSYKWAGGGFLSTPEDLVRFAYAVLDGTLVDAGARELLFASQRTSEGRETGYGIGWYTARDEDGPTWVYHGGGSIGGRTMLLLAPERGAVVALAANAGFAPMSRELAERVLAPFLAATAEASSEGAPADEGEAAEEPAAAPVGEPPADGGGETP